MRAAHEPVKVAVLAFPETSASVVYGVYDLLAAAGRDWGIIVGGEPGRVLFEPMVVSARSGSFAASNGVILSPERTLAQCPLPDIACVPEINLPPSSSLEGMFTEEIDWLRDCYERGTTLATACSGAMLLAQAGLLDGLEATTHWAWCDELSRRFPQVKVRGQRALIVTGVGQRLIMAGGGTSWLDLALYLIARFAGVEAAMQVARINLIDWHAVGQQPFAHLARSRQVQDAVIARCQEWLAMNYRDPSPVAAMARLSGLAERTFKRRFRLATGMAPLEYVHALRLEEAKQMLEAGDQPVESIANEVGYEDSSFFRRLFRKHVGLTPIQYRRRFSTMRRSLLDPAALAGPGAR